MAPTKALDSAAQLLEAEFLRSWDLFQAGDGGSAHRSCIWLLSKPMLGDWHRAGCHLIMAYSDDQPVVHAQQALLLYTKMSKNEEALPAQRITMSRFLRHARLALTAALEAADKDAITDEEHREYLQSLMDAEDEEDEDEQAEDTAVDASEFELTEEEQRSEAELREREASAERFLADLDEAAAADDSEGPDSPTIITAEEYAAIVQRQNAYLGIADDESSGEEVGTAATPSKAGQEPEDMSPRLPDPGRLQAPPAAPVTPSSSQFKTTDEPDAP